MSIENCKGLDANKELEAFESCKRKSLELVIEHDDLIEQLNRVNIMLDLHSDNESKFMYNQYKEIRDNIIKQL